MKKIKLWICGIICILLITVLASTWLVYTANRVPDYEKLIQENKLQIKTEKEAIKYAEYLFEKASPGSVSKHPIYKVSGGNGYSWVVEDITNVKENMLGGGRWVSFTDQGELISLKYFM